MKNCPSDPQKAILKYSDTKNPIIANNLLRIGSDVSVSIIDTYGYDLKSLCTLETPYTYALVDSVSPDGVTQVILGPPQPIISISCRSNLPIRAIRSTD